jgi:hypothetical protein
MCSHINFSYKRARKVKNNRTYIIYQRIQTQEIVELVFISFPDVERIFSPKSNNLYIYYAGTVVRSCLRRIDICQYLNSWLSSNSCLESSQVEEADISYNVLKKHKKLTSKVCHILISRSIVRSTEQNTGINMHVVASKNIYTHS